MSKEKKIEIHEKLVDVYFGKDESPDTNAKIRDLPNNLTQLLGKVVENASSFVDGVNGKAKEPEKAEDKKEE